MKQTLFGIFLFLFSAISSFSQTSKGESPIESGQKMMEEFTKGMSTEFTKSSQTIPQGNVVNPEYYFVGPGDILSLTIMPLVPYPMSLTVSPSRTLIIPRFGEIELNNKTLRQAQDTIQQFLALRNKDIKISLVLQQARLCLVSIRGNVIFPNVYTVPASFQISSAINYANKINSENVPAEQYKAISRYNEQIRERERIFNESKFYPVSNYFSRNVVVLHNDGTSQNIDIEKSKAYNEARYNPYIREGDEIIVPFEFDNYPTIQISGEVNRPISVPYKQGDKASLLLKLGFGLTPNADPDNIVLYTDDKKINIIADSLGNLKQPDFDISAGSILIVGALEKSVVNKISTVNITGEVRKPGIFVIENDKTRLKDLIDMAGGFTEKAHLPLATIYRFDKNAEYKMDVKKEFNESFQYSNLTLEDTTRFMIDMQYAKNYVSCDFDKLFNQNDQKYNVVLRGGDILNIPQQPRQVYVYGQVTNPGYIEYVSGKTLDYYVEKAGGYAYGAEKERARIIRGRNLIWDQPDENVFVNAGDQIYVPRKPDIPAWLEIQRYSVYAAAIGTAATVINILWGIYLNSKK